MRDGYDVTIVGAGIAGLAAAVDLSAAGLRTVLLDKGRQVGGRMATRRIPTTAFDTGGGSAAFDTGGGSTAFDTGAQFFTAMTPEFRTVVEHAAAQEAVTHWYQRPPRRPGEASQPVWCGSTGMTDLPKWIAENLRRTEMVDLRTSHRVTGLAVHSEGVTIFADSGDSTSDLKSIRTRSVILTPPVPQALRLLPGDIRAEIDPGIAELDYAPCLAALVSLDEHLEAVFNEYGWFRPSRDNGVIAWAADNARKGRSGHGPRALPRITIHSTAEAARELYEREDSHVVTELIEACSSIVPVQARGVLRRALSRGAVDLKKWRYARPNRRWHELSARIAPGVYLAGDSFGGGRVEGAFVSGSDAARAIIKRSS